MIDVMFTAAADVGVVVATPEGEVDKGAQASLTDKEKGIWQFTDKRVLDDKRDQIISALGRQFDTVFIRKSGAYFWNASHEKRLVCTLSKRYESNSVHYWYGYRKQWRDFLVEQGAGQLVLGCVDLPFAFAVPASVMEPLLKGLSTTMKDDDVAYWHIFIAEAPRGRYVLSLPNQSEPYSLEKYQVRLS